MTDYLIPGQEVLARHHNFKLVGRGAEMKKLASILVRQKSNSVLLTGPGGVGCTSLILGLQRMKTDINAPFDIVAKRFLWLDVDALFASGKAEVISAAFQKAMDRLSATPDSVLVIEDSGDFLEACRNNGTTHFINALTSATREGKTQVILEVSDHALDRVLKWHSDIQE